MYPPTVLDPNSNPQSVSDTVVVPTVHLRVVYGFVDNAFGEDGKGRLLVLHAFRIGPGYEPCRYYGDVLFDDDICPRMLSMLCLGFDASS